MVQEAFEEWGNGSESTPPIGDDLASMFIGHLTELDEFTPDDLDRVREAFEGFMGAIYGTHRYVQHNDRILALYKEFFATPDTDGPSHSDVSLADRETILGHDFVDHCILRPDKTAECSGWEADDIKNSALTVLIDLYRDVDDQDSLEKAYLFGIDKAKWEEAGRVWRDSARDRIKQEVGAGTIGRREAAILRDAIYKTADLEDINQKKLIKVLNRPQHLLLDLKLEDISLSVVNYNIKGAVIYGLEMLDNLRHPDPDNPAALYRDRIEALSFLAPTLMMLGYKNPAYKRLANEIRGAALESIYPDPHGYAAEQHAVSEKYFDDIEKPVFGLLDSDFGGITSDREGRGKTEGALREKFTLPKYKKVKQTPDGVGFAFVVPDDMTGSEMRSFAEEYRAKLIQNSHIKIGHPLGETEAFEDIRGKKSNRKSDYEAVHMTFYYYPDPEEQPELAVPFEIQILTKYQHTQKTFGPWADVFYKNKSRFQPGDELHSDHLAKRAAAERDLSPGTTVQSIAEMVAQTPEFPSVFNQFYAAVNADGARILVPKKLQELSKEILLTSSNEENYLTVLPPELVTEQQFFTAITKFSPELANDKNIRTALEWAKESEAGSFRNNGRTPVFEGHILPTTLSALMLAIQSGEIWSDDEISVVEHISNIVTIALLHDYVEKEMEAFDEDIDQKMQARGLALYRIRREFGETVRNSVEALTNPVDIEDDIERREQTTENVESDPYALFIKPADRPQNHMTDIIAMAEAEAGLAAAKNALAGGDPAMTPEHVSSLEQAADDIKQQAFTYVEKTEQHLARIFTSGKLPKAYARVYDTLLQYFKHFGYQSLAER